MSSTIPLGGRRSCTRSIHWPERSARTDRFFSAASHLVSKRPIWLGGAQRPRHDPAMQWIVGGKAARPSNDVRRSYANFTYQAGSWNKPRRVVAKAEWLPGELYPRVGFTVTNMSRPAENVVAFYNKRGTCEQWIKEGKGAIKWTRLSCRSFTANAVRLQLHALAYNLGNFLRTLAAPEPIKDWSLTTLKQKLSGFQGAEPTGLPPHSTHWCRHGLAEPEPPIKGLAPRCAGLGVVRAS